MMSYQTELETALEAARQASAAIRAAYTEFVAIPDARADISTHADRQAQEIILGLLQTRFPGDAFCAEEKTPALAGKPHTGPRLWIVDPIDGTRGFAKKNGEFSVMIGFVEKDDLALGVVLEPASARLTYAVRGGGCWRQDDDAVPQRCIVSATTDLRAATLTQSHSRTGMSSTPTQALAPAKIVEKYSAGLKLALVARGEADVYINTYTAFHDWDICAGQVLVEEAGGKVTGLAGQTLLYGTEGAWQRHGLLATNGALHEKALQRLREHNLASGGR